MSLRVSSSASRSCKAGSLIESISMWPISSLLILSSLLLASCGGSGGGSNGGDADGGESTDWVPGVFPSSNQFYALCETPRSGTHPITGNPWPDLAGSTLLENNWLRSWTNETYLWYDEVIDRDPALYSTPDYFDLLKTSAITASGKEKDPAHFTVPTEEYIAQSQSGVDTGYGMRIVSLTTSAPFNVLVAYVEPNSPASAAGLERGARVIAIDGADGINPSNAEVDILNAALRPENVGESHRFVFRDLGATDTRTVDLVSSVYTSTPVTGVTTIDTDSGKVGYMFFDSHIATAERLLVEAIDQLSSESIDDLVLDLRYNSGGFGTIANQLAYMIAGAGATDGKTFVARIFNDKNPIFNPVTEERNDPSLFENETVGFSLAPGQALPSLDLDRVFILTTGTTCSASELIINGLRGIGVEVVLIGDTTCGKPYGFYGTDNCGTAYFSIQMQSVNDVGFGDYADGFSPQNVASPGSVSVPGCGAADDFEHALGDTDEALLATALEYRETDSCPLSLSFSAGEAREKEFNRSTPSLISPKSEWLQNVILDFYHE